MTTAPASLRMPAEEFAQRRERAVQGARERGLNGLLVWSRGGTTVDYYGDVLYLANYHSPFPQAPENPPLWTGRGYTVLVLPVEGEPVLITDLPDYREDLVEIEDVRPAHHVAVAAAEAVREKGLTEGTLGLVGGDSFLHRSYLQFGAALDGAVPRLEPADEVVAALRRIKSANELALVRNAAAVGIGWMERTMETVAAGRTEGDCVGEGLRYAAANGGYPYDVAVASGENSDHAWWSSLPSWDYERELRDGDLIHFDIWGPVKGYFTDFVRSTVVGGNPSDGQREVLEGSVALIEHILAAVEPGVAFSDLYRRGSAWIAEHGFGAEDGASADLLSASAPMFGHGLGLGIEAPWVTATETLVAEENMVIAVEALLGREGVGSAGFEQNVVVTGDGVEVLTAPCASRWWS